MLSILLSPTPHSNSLAHRHPALRTCRGPLRWTLHESGCGTTTTSARRRSRCIWARCHDLSISTSGVWRILAAMVSSPGTAGPAWHLDCATWWLHATRSAASHRQPRTRCCRGCQPLGFKMTDPDPDALDRDVHLAERRYTSGMTGPWSLLAGEDVSREGLQVALESARTRWIGWDGRGRRSR